MRYESEINILKHTPDSFQNFNQEDQPEPEPKPEPSEPEPKPEAEPLKETPIQKDLGFPRIEPREPWPRK